MSNIFDLHSKKKIGGEGTGGGDEPPTIDTKAKELMTQALMDYVDICELGELAGLGIVGIDTQGRAARPIAIVNGDTTMHKLYVLLRAITEHVEGECMDYLEPRPDDSGDEE